MRVPTENARAIAVWWEDAFSHDGWTSDVASLVKTKCMVLSVGVELANDEGGITMALSCNAAEQYGGVWKIPRGMVKRVRVLGRLKVPKEK